MLKLTKKHFKKLSILMALLFVFSNTAVFAESFKDIPEGYWAEKYIDNVSKAGIIKGDGAGNFKPADNVTKSQAAIMIARMMGIDATKTLQARQEYQDFLTQQNIPTWGQDGVAVALAAGVVTKEEVEDFVVNGKETFAQKVEIARWLTKAMYLDEEARKQTIVALPFKDAVNISALDARYVKMMINKGVVSPEGDAEGKFNPTSPIRRDEIAKMLSVAYDYMTANLLLNRPFEDDETEIKTETVEGTIYSIMRGNNEYYISADLSTGKRTTYLINSDTKVTIDGEIIDYKLLIEGLEFEAEVTEDYKVISFDAESITEEYSGKIKSIVQTDPPMLTIEYYPDEDSKKTEAKSFYIDPSADIYLDGEEVFLRHLSSGDTVEINVKNSKIVEINAESRFLEYSGVIKDIKLTSSQYSLVIEDEDENIIEYPLDDNVSIYRNKSKAKVTDLKKGDAVTIDIEYGEITDIEAKVVKKEGEGSIVSILQASKPQLTILNNDGEEETYYIALGATIRLDRIRADLYDLKPGYYLEFTAEGDEITSLYAETRQRNQILIGTISSITTKHSIITITTEDLDGNTIERTIVYADDTAIMDLYGDTVRESALDIGDQVIIIGNYSDTFIEAESIIIPYEK